MNKLTKVANYLVKKYGANPDQDRVAETILGERDEISSAFPSLSGTLGDFKIQLESLLYKKLRYLIKNVEQTTGPNSEEAKRLKKVHSLLVQAGAEFNNLLFDFYFPPE